MGFLTQFFLSKQRHFSKTDIKTFWKTSSNSLFLLLRF